MRPTWSYFSRFRPHPTSITAQRAVAAAYYRGGTSRAVIIKPQDLPHNHKAWPKIFRLLMGSGDRFGNLPDGMGVGIPNLCNICLVEPHVSREKNQVGQENDKHDVLNPVMEAEEPHIDYTFVRLNVEEKGIDLSANCVNMSSAIGPYAYNERLLPRDFYALKDGVVTIRIRNTNTEAVMESTFRVIRGQAATGGDFAIDGVPGSGSEVKLDFLNAHGNRTGKLLPTGKRIDSIDGRRVTCIDGPDTVVFIRADSVGINGTALPHELRSQPGKLELLESIRKAAAVAMGLADGEEAVLPNEPKVAIVSQSTEHSVLSGAEIKAPHVDLVVRYFANGELLRTAPLAAAMTTAIAARIPGTIVEQLLAPELASPDAITIGYASGKLHVDATADLQVATVYRTAKRLFEGKAYWTEQPGDSEEQRPDAGQFRHSLGISFVKELQTKATQNLSLGSSKTNGIQEDDDDEVIAIPPVPLQPQNSVLDELYKVQRSVAHMSSKYPPPLSEKKPATPFPTPSKPKVATPSHIRHHLTAIEHHLATLVSSLENTPTVGTKGESWHKWAKSLSKRRSWLREAVEKKERKEALKPRWERARDQRLWSLGKDGNLLYTKKGRMNLRKNYAKLQASIERQEEQDKK